MRMRTCPRCSLLLAALASAACPGGLRAQPLSDIWLVPLARTTEGWQLGTPVNATRRRGYDNQPAFLADGTAFLFTAIGDDGQADTYRYHVDSGAVTRVTATPESEYSPTPMRHRPGWFSTVRVEADSTQRLWAIRQDGLGTELLLPDVAPVGYHAWIDGGGLALFVLGRPPTLQVIPEPGAPPRTAVAGIGRSLVAVPGERAVLFVQSFTGGNLISRLDVPSQVVRPLVATPAADFFTWHEGTLFVPAGTRVLAFRPGTDREWTPIGDLAVHGIRGLTRLAVSPDGAWMAVVAEDP